MTSLAEFLFPAPAERRPVAIIRWWESRRLAYNAIVGTTGLITLGVVGLLLSLPPNSPELVLPWQPVVAYGVMANVCYGLGAVVEIALRKLWGPALLPVGPALFRMGLTFSVGLTLFPILIATLGWLFRFFDWLL